MINFYDTEFLEDGKTIDLISIGIYAEDGRSYYAVSNEFDTRRVAKNNWLMKNVMSSIQHEQFIVADAQGFPVVRDFFVTDPAAKDRATIAHDIYSFCLQDPSDTKTELWHWFGAYDHVALCQLYGTMMELPCPPLPMYSNDLKTLVSLAGYPKMPFQGPGKHNALEDAKFNKVRYDYLKGLLNGSITISS